MEIKKQNWEKSYMRGENFIFYPKEEIVKFINRFIIKKKSIHNYEQILNSPNRLKALDFGSGIGRTTILLHEFNIEGYGIDISENAIKQSKKLAKELSFNLDNYFNTYDGIIIPFENDFFDFTIADGVLDSMSYEVAKNSILQLEKVTKNYLFLSLISSKSMALFDELKNNKDFSEEIEVKEEHEKGTIQSFFNIKKIKNLIENTKFKIKSCYLHEQIDCINNNSHARYYLILEKTIIK